FPVTHDERLPNLYGQVAWYSTNMQRDNVALSLLATGGDFLFADDGDSALRQIISRSTPQTRRESDFNNKIGDRLQTFFLNEQETFSAAAQSDDDYVQSALNLLIEQQDRSLLLKIIFQTQQTQLILTTVFLNDRTVLALELLQDYVDSLSLDNKIKELSQLLNAFYAVSDRQEDKKTFFYYLYKMALGSLSSFYINAILAKTLESESLFQQICSRTYIATDFLLALTQQLSAHKECAEIVFLLMYCRAKLVTFEAISQFPNKLLSGGDYQNKKAIALKEMIQLIEEHANKINDEAWKTLLLRLAPDIFGESLSSDALLKHNSASLTDLSVFSSPKKHVTFTEVASVTSISKTTLLADIEAQITAQKQNEKTYCVMALEMLKSMMQMLLPEQAVEETAAKILDTWQLLDSGIQKKIPIESPVSEYFTNYELIEASADDVARQALHPQTTARWVASTLWNSARVIKFRPSATTKLKDNKEFIDSFIDKHFHQPFSSPDQLVQPHLDAQSRPA
ncbi:MAG: hypothetical protein NTU49_09930, partial [Gammaproteobacteria bacterium]|nr:hypothetical protein [Gammaproteobacteria bacterium]